jgi:hypothetical protein
MAEKGGILKFMAEYDRRWIYVLIFVVVTAPLIQPLGFPISVSPDTVVFHRVLSSVNKGDKVLFTLDTEFSGYMEIQSGIIASMRVLVNRGAKICVAVGHPEATAIPQLIFDAVAGEMQAGGYQYGRDYIDLGYILPNESAVAALAQDFHSVVRQDSKGASIQGTFLDDVTDWSSWALIADFTTGLATSYIRAHMALRGTPMIVNMIGVSIPTERPFYDTGIYKAVLGSMRGGAELEYLIGRPGPGMTAMDAFTLGHYMLIAFIVIGNIGYFGYTRNLKKKPGGA